MRAFSEIHLIAASLDLGGYGEFGVFANLAAIGASLASTVTAMRLAFMKRSKWQPPQEALPDLSARFSAAFAMIVVALLFVFGAELGVRRLALVTLFLLATALWSMVTTIRTNLKYSFYYPGERIEQNRTLGGNKLTVEAAAIQRRHGTSEQQLFEDAQGDKNLVWTRDSQATVMVRSTLSFIFLIGLGTSSVAAAAMLVVVFVGAPSTNP